MGRHGNGPNQIEAPLILSSIQTVCMHDDHGLRKVWEGTAHTIATLEFPCNFPATGCQDNDYSGPPSCGCADTLASDAPEDSCKNCRVMGTLPPETLFA